MAFVYYNANPERIETSDCTVRAISKVLNQDWIESYWGICVQGAIEHKMPSTNSVWGSYLERNGFKRKAIRLFCPECESVKKFCKYNPRGVYVLGTGTHVIAVINGDYYDIWDSGDEIPLYYFTKES